MMRKAGGNISRRRERGSTLIVALWVMAVLVGLAIVLADSSGVELGAVKNREMRAETDAAERGAEQWILSVVDQETTTVGTIASMESQGRFQARIIGECAVWVIKPHEDLPEEMAFGLMDEGGKIDLNGATEEMLAKLPGMTQEAVDAIMDWRDADSTTTGLGAEDDFYSDVNNHPDTAEAYKAKNADLESVEELRLVRWVDETLLYGNDRNHNGVADDQVDPNAATGLMAAQDASRGIYPFVTVWGLRATTPATNTTTSGTQAAALVDVNSNSTTALRRLLESNVPAKSDSILTATRQLRPFANVFDWYFKVGLTQDELSKIFTQLTANPPAPVTPGTTQPAVAVAPRVAKVNVYTASREVLYCLPGMEEADAEAIIGQRNATATTNPADLSWLVGVLTPEKLRQMGGYVTGSSKIYSADIVAVSPNGRTFRRVKIVIDARTSPAKIIFRRDMTGAGWPLDPLILSQLKAGGGFTNVTPLTQADPTTAN